MHIYSRKNKSRPILSFVLTNNRKTSLSINYNLYFYYVNLEMSFFFGDTPMALLLTEVKKFELKEYHAIT